MIKLKLRVKLLLVFFMIISISCSVLGYLSYRQASDALQNAIEDQLQDTVKNTAELINASLYTSRKIVEVASDKTEFITAAVTGNGEGAVVTVKALQQENSGAIDDVMIVDRNGQVVYGLLGSNISLKERSYFMKAIAGQEAMSDVVMSKISNKPVIVLAQPLRKDGQIVGVLCALMDFGSLTKKVSDLKVGETGYGFIIDKTGLTLNHPNKEFVLKENMLQNKEEQVRIFAQKMLAGKAGKTTYSYQGVEKLVAYAPVGDFVVAINAPVAEYMAPVRTILRNTILIVGVTFVIALAIAFGFANSIVKPISKLCGLMAAAGAGDLTLISNLKNKDEIGDLSRSFDIMITSQRAIVTEVRSASAELAMVSEEMAASCQEVTSTSEEIASNMQVITSETESGHNSMMEASKSLERLSDLIQSAKEKANVATDNSKITYSAAQDGLDKVTEAVTRMQNIKEQTHGTSKIITKLSDHSKQIGQIVDTITAIAAQTNLLALNAAIEAARAGEQGRGFAVVAEEVRKLAEQSNQGAQEITTLIREVTDSTKEAVEAMSNNAGEVESGVVVVVDAGKSLEKIMEAVRVTVSEIEGINQVTAEEVVTSEQIIKVIDQLTEITEAVVANCQHIASGTEQQASAMQTVSASSEEANTAANQLKELVEKFKV